MTREIELELDLIKKRRQPAGGGDPRPQSALQLRSAMAGRVLAVATTKILEAAGLNPEGRAASVSRHGYRSFFVIEAGVLRQALEVCPLPSAHSRA